jgi:hypothetical protein
MSSAKFIFISVVVPSVNGNQAKLLVVFEDEFKKIKEYSTSNYKTNIIPYSMFMESNSLHQFLGNGGYLTKEQFNEILQSIYNSTTVYTKKNKELKNA